MAREVCSYCEKVPETPLKPKLRRGWCLECDSWHKACALCLSSIGWVPMVKIVKPGETEGTWKFQLCPGTWKLISGLEKIGGRP